MRIKRAEKRTLRRILSDAAERFSSAGIKEEEALYILSEVSGLSKNILKVSGSEHLSPEIESLFEDYVSVRLKKNPIQYITEKAYFYGHSFKVTSDTLIPRMETELLVESALERIKSLNNAKVLEFGTGSGNIAISIALNRIEYLNEKMCPPPEKESSAAASIPGSSLASYERIYSDVSFVRKGGAVHDSGRDVDAVMETFRAGAVMQSAVRDEDVVQCAGELTGGVQVAGREMGVIQNVGGEDNVVPGACRAGGTIQRGVTPPCSKRQAAALNSGGAISLKVGTIESKEDSFESSSASFTSKLGKSFSNLSGGSSDFQTYKGFITAVESSAAALKIAKENADSLGAAEYIDFINTDMIALLETPPEYMIGKYDIIVSNPPYVSDEEYSELEAEVLREPRGALLAGPEGLDYIQMIIRNGAKLLKDGGCMLVETGDTQKDSVMSIAERSPGIIEPDYIKDYSGRDRIFVCRIQKI